MKFLSKDSTLTRFLLLTAVVSLPLSALDYSTERLRKLGNEFNAADEALLALSKQATCSLVEFETANTNAAKIRDIKKEVDGLVSDLNLEIKEREIVLGVITKKLDPKLTPKPEDFLKLQMELALNDKPTEKIIEPYFLNKLIELVNLNTQISFVDSTGKRRIANNKNAAALDKDKEAKSVLASVALSWISDDSKLRSFDYSGGAIADTQSRRLSNSKSKSANMFYLSDSELGSLSADLQDLQLNAGISVEALPMVANANENGAVGISDMLRKFRVQVTEPSLKKVLSNVREANRKIVAAKQVSAEERETLKIQESTIKAELGAMKDAAAKWSQLATNLDFPTSAAVTRLAKCKSAQKAHNKKVEDAKASRSSEGESKGVLKGIDLNHSKAGAEPAEAPKK